MFSEILQKKKEQKEKFKVNTMKLENQETKFIIKHI